MVEYGSSFDPNGKNNKAIENCIIARTDVYKDLYDEELWLLFKEEFTLWTEQHLRQAPLPTLFKLRSTLRSNGIYVIKNRDHPAISLAAAAVQDDMHEWTENEVIRLIQHRELLNSPNLNLAHGEAIQRLQNSTNRPLQQNTRFEQPETPTPQPAAPPGPITRQRSQLLQAPESTPMPSSHFFNPTTPGATTAYAPIMLSTTPGHQYDNESYAPQPPPGTPPNDMQQQPPVIPYAVSFANIQKGIKDEMKYSGHEDSFDQSYSIFLRHCRYNGINDPGAQNDALLYMLKGEALRVYLDNIDDWNRRRISAASEIKNNFENETHLRHIQGQWEITTLPYIIERNPDKSISECLEILLTRLRFLYNKLRPESRNEVIYHSKLLSATRTVQACHQATGKPSHTVAGVIQDLRESVSVHEDTKRTAQPVQHVAEALYTDRRYHNRQSRSPYRGCNSRGNSRPRDSHSRDRYDRRSQSTTAPRICIVCHKPDCWSTNHTAEERAAARKRDFKKYDAYMAQSEGRALAPNSQDDDTDNAFIRFLTEVDTPSTYEVPEREVKGSTPATLHFTVATPEHPKFARKLAAELANRSAAHFLSSLFNITGNITAPTDNDDDTALTTISQFSAQIVPEYSFLTESRYSSNTFMGILLDTGASQYSTAGYAQYLAYRKTVKGVVLDQSKAGQATIQFGPGEPLSSLGTVDVDTPIGTIQFHVIEAMTPFLLSLKDMDNLDIFFDNTKNIVVRREPYMTAPVVRRFGHPFLMWDYSLASFLTESFDTDTCFLTDTELRRLHRRFGHPSVGRLHKLLTRAGHDADTEALEYITKFCHHCQIHGKSPGRFRFTVRDDVEFNHSIIVDVMYIDGKPVLHIVDEATRFNAACWLANISSKHIWDMIRMIWIDMYLGPPDFIVTDAGKNFTSKEFAQHATSIGTIVATVPVEAHWSIGTVERYHAVLRRSYEIIKEELPEASPEIALQMAVKSVNDTTGPNGLTPTLLLFGAYPRMTEYDPPAPTITQRAAAIQKAMTEVRQLRARRQVANAINTRNGPSSTLVHRLPINSDVLVWREGGTNRSGKWTGPYKLLAIENETCTVELSSGPTNFRSTVVKPYNKEDNDAGDTHNNDQADDNEAIHDTTPEVIPSLSPPTPTVATPEPQPDNTRIERPRRQVRPSARWNDDLERFEHYLQPDAILERFVIYLQYDDSRRVEVNGLLEGGVFIGVDAEDIPPGTRLFTMRFVDEVKNPGTDKAYEKSRLVVQAYNDEDKVHVLTQSPTIQRPSQRIVICIGISKEDTSFYIRDITQAYIQSTTLLNRDFYIRIPPGLAQYFPGYEFLKAVRPLYGIPEAGNHWFRTYHRHHTEKLGMETSTYDPCLLHCTDPEQGFGVIGMQTDDTLIVADDTFAAREEEEVKRAKLICKPREHLTSEKPLKFNGAIITEDCQGIAITQERTISHIRLVQDAPADTITSRGKVRKNASPREQYVAQRALGAYIASVSQPEAAFDLSYAAQTTSPGKDDIKALNNRLQWQQENPKRGLHFVKINLQSARLFAFVDASFANNKDYSSQIGYVIVLADEENNANILHWSSIKCKRITRSVLASETYAMAHGFDAAAVIKSTITQLLHLTEPLPLVVCTDSKSLYECLVKLGTMQEKRLMIDLMCLRQSYERQEITEVRWIDGDSNPADAMTKNKPCRALQELIDTNKLNVNINGWVERSSMPRTAESKAVKFATPLISQAT